MDIIDIVRKAQKEATEDLLIFNPLNKDVTCTYDGQPYTIPSKENKAFKKPLARHIGNYLVNLYLNTKGDEYAKEKAEALVFP